jgi:transposase
MSSDAAVPPPDPLAPLSPEQLRQLVRELVAREAQVTAALAESSETIAQQQQQLEKLAHEMALLKRCVFGSRRERLADDPRQQTLFELSAAERGPDQPTTPAPDTSDVEEVSDEKRRGHGRRRLPQTLPRKRIEYPLPASELGCPCCGQARRKISEVVTEQLDYTPASLYIVEHVQFTYACACDACEGHVATAAKPPQPIEKGLAGPGLLAHVITAKYVQHLPLYRQEDDLARAGVLIRRSTLAGWMAGAAACLAPLFELLKRRVLASQVVGTDDTPVKVLDPELDHTRTGRFWAYVGDDRHPYTVYDYTASRRRDGPQAFLTGFEGVLQADAFGGYDGIFLDSQETILEAGCCAHARRKFFDARTTSPDVAHAGLAYFRRLYAIEVEAGPLSDDARLALRQQKSLPILDDFRAWMNEQLPLLRPKTPVAVAIKYCLRHWDALTRFTTDGAIPIDNNRTERTLRAQALGRKNWLFLGSDQGGVTASVLYSLVASAKRHQLDPQAYLADVLARLPSIVNPLELRALLPDRWAKSHPEYIRQYRQAESEKAAQRRLNRRARRQTDEQ